MKTFKQYLTESSVASYDVKGMDIEDLIDCYRNAGYEVPKNEVKFFLDCKHIEYTKSRQHKFAVMMKDDGNSDDEFYISMFYVELGKDGKVTAEPSGNPLFGGDEASVQKKYNSL